MIRPRKPLRRRVTACGLEKFPVKLTKAAKRRQITIAWCERYEEMQHLQWRRSRRAEALLRDLEWVTQRWPLEISDEDRAFLEQGAEQHRQQTEMIESILNAGGGLDGAGWREPLVEPRGYQLQASDIVLTSGRLLVGDDLGLGKTFTGLLTLRHPESTPALVVCPTHLQRQWEEQIHRFFPLLRTHRLRSTKVYDPASRRDMKGHDPDVLVVNYHKLAAWQDHLAGKIRTTIFDEIQELRIPGSGKYEAAALIAGKARFRVGLSATPVYNHGGEAHSIIRLLEPDALGTLTEFQREWGGRVVGRGGQTMVNDPAALGAYLRDQGLFLRRTRADVGRELPPVTRITHSVDVDSEPLAAVEGQLRELARVIMQSADTKAVFKAKGELDWRLRQATGLAKAPHVADLVQLLLESEKKVVVYAWHRPVYDVFLKRLKDYRPVMYTGTESPTQKAEAARAFIEDDDRRVFLCSLRSGAGLDGLQEVCNVAVFGELDWAPGVHDQCIGRLNRDGQIGGVSAYFCVADSGSDPVVAEKLGIKRMQSEGIHNPDGTLFEPVPDAVDHLRQLAANYLGMEEPS